MVGHSAPAAVVAVEVVVRWADMDAYAHVNNAVYLNYAEEARDRLIAGLFGEASYDFVLAHVGIDYRHEVTQDDGLVRVQSRLTGWSRSTVRTAEVIRLSDETVAAECEAVLVAREHASGRSRPLSSAERELLIAAAPDLSP